jgi:hypothetical protein
MTSPAVLRAQRLRVLLARIHAYIGWPGVVGLALVVGSALAIGSARLQATQSQRGTHSSESSTPRASDQAGPSGEGTVLKDPRVSAMTLPSRAEVALLLTQVEWAAIRRGLGWPQADYRLNTSTDGSPTTLEIRCQVKGTYPDVRGFVGALLRDIPTLTLRELKLSRPNTASADIEAKLSFEIFLGSSRSTVTTVRQGSSPSDNLNAAR